MAPEKRRISLVSDEQKRKLIEDNAVRVANMDKTIVFNKPSSSSSGKSPAASKRAKVDDLPTVINKLKETNEKNRKKSQPATNSLKVHREVGKTVEKKASTTDKQKRKLMDEAASRAKISKHEKGDEFNNARDKAYTRFKMMLRKKKTTGEVNDEEDDGDDEDGAGKRKGKKKGQKGDSCYCNDVDETADSSRDSDEDDGEGRREFDDTSSSDAEREPDEDSEEENENEDTEEDEDDDEEMDDKGPMFDDKSDKKKKSSPENGKKSTKEDFGLSTLKDISTSEREKVKSSPKPKSANNSRSATPKKVAAAAAGASSSGRKRKSGTAAGEGSSGRSATKRRLDLTNSSSAASSPAAKSSAKKVVNEDSVRRYLQRKPMTTKELIEKFKSKKTGLSENQLVRDISQTLKKMNLGKGTTRGDMRLFLLDE